MKSWQRCLLAAIGLAMAGGPAVAQNAPLGTPLPSKPLGMEIADDRGPEAFLANQLTFGRVAEARATTDAALRTLFDTRGVAYPADEIYLRVFKHERVLELWARGGRDSVFTLVKEYPVCALPGQLGPKQQMGDFQVPEGFYFIDGFNPNSSYHLSLRVSYPNLSDRLRQEAVSLGGDIYVHGGCATIGCVPIENDKIREVYWLAVQAMDAGQRVIPIHIFPSRMDTESIRWLERTFQPGPELHDFWRNLAEGYAFFEQTRRVPWITVAPDGRYVVPPFERVVTEPVDTMDSGDVSPPADSARPATGELGGTEGSTPPPPA